MSAARDGLDACGNAAELWAAAQKYAPESFSGGDRDSELSSACREYPDGKICP